MTFEEWDKLCDGLEERLKTIIEQARSAENELVDIRIKRIEETIKAVKQEPCEDGAWSLKDVTDALKRHGLLQEQEPCKDESSSEKPNNCEDAISRADTIEWLKRVTVTDGITFETGFKQILTDIQNMPSVTPKQKMGRWITQWNAAHQKEYYYCSECREEYSYDGETGIKMNDYDFCPNCGAKMEESED